jgi:hypothetical protein
LASSGNTVGVRFVLSLVVLILAVVGAMAIRERARAGVLGRREAYGRPMSDWAGVTMFGVGAGLSALVAGIRWLAWMLIAAVVVESFLTLQSVRPKRGRG